MKKPAFTLSLVQPAQSPDTATVYRAAKGYVASGLSFIPIGVAGDKRPAFHLLPHAWSEAKDKYVATWKQYKTVPPTIQEIQEWYRDSDSEVGMAILGGAVSGGLEIVDCDNWDVAQHWVRLVESQLPGLLKRLVLVQSPRPGLHVYYRCSEIGGNQKLARVPDPTKDNKKPKTVIEIKGEGGYCLAPPSPAECHPRGICYTFLSSRDLTRIPMISVSERDMLHACARLLDCWKQPERPEQSSRIRRTETGAYQRPGDAFNALADWSEILKPHGWGWQGQGAESGDHWCRPGKSEGTSATTDFGGSDLMYVFSSNADLFEADRAYTKFHAFALLNHAGDFRAAARALVRKGYGASQLAGRVADPFARYRSFRRSS